MKIARRMLKYPMRSNHTENASKMTCRLLPHDHNTSHRDLARISAKRVI